MLTSPLWQLVLFSPHPAKVGQCRVKGCSVRSGNVGAAAFLEQFYRSKQPEPGIHDDTTDVCTADRQTDRQTDEKSSNKSKNGSETGEVGTGRKQAPNFSFRLAFDKMNVRLHKPAADARPWQRRNRQTSRCAKPMWRRGTEQSPERLLPKLLSFRSAGQ